MRWNHVLRLALFFDPGEIVSQHGGIVRAESCLPRGVEFTVELEAVE